MLTKPAHYLEAVLLMLYVRAAGSPALHAQLRTQERGCVSCS